MSETEEISRNCVHTVTRYPGCTRQTKRRRICSLLFVEKLQNENNSNCSYQFLHNYHWCNIKFCLCLVCRDHVEQLYFCSLHRLLASVVICMLTLVNCDVSKARVHRRMEHINFGMKNSLIYFPPPTCESCVYFKSRKTMFVWVNTWSHMV